MQNNAKKYTIQRNVVRHSGFISYSSVCCVPDALRVPTLFNIDALYVSTLFNINALCVPDTLYVSTLFNIDALCVSDTLCVPTLFRIDAFVVWCMSVMLGGIAEWSVGSMARNIFIQNI